MYRNLFLTVLLAAASFTNVSAEEADSNLVIHLKDGTSMSCLLSYKPTIKFTLSELIVNSENSSFTVPLDNLARFGFENQSSAIEIIKSEKANYTIDDNRIIVNGLKAGDHIRLYRVDGICVFDKVNNAENGTLEIAIDALSSGIYMLNINNTTAKIAIK